jgi:hypothetical protein
VTVHEREDDLVVARLHALAPHLDGEPDPDFRARTRARLVAMAAVRTPAPAPVSPLRRLLVRADDAASARWRSRLTAGLAGAALTVTALATLVAVATGAGPGDPLYGLKRGTEETQLALAGDARGQVLLDLARTRLHELEDLAEGGTTALPAPAAPTRNGLAVSAAGVDTTLVLETLETMDEQTLEGAAWLTRQAVSTGDGELLTELTAWSEAQTAGLTALRSALPDSTLDELDTSLGLLGDIDVRGVALAEVLDCPSGPPIESTDALGPVPGLCLPTPAPPVAGGEGGQPGTESGSTAPGGSTAGGTAVPGGTDGGAPGSTGSDDGSGGVDVPGVPALPSGEETTGETPGLPLPSLPSTSLPTVPTLPGGSTSSSGSTTTSTSSTTTPPLLPCVPLPPLIQC